MLTLPAGYNNDFLQLGASILAILIGLFLTALVFALDKFYIPPRKKDGDYRVETTENDQTAPFIGLAQIKKDRNWWMKFVRWAFKGEKLEVYTDGDAYMKLLEPLRVDLTNGWIYAD